MARKTKQEALATRGAILDAAEALFHRHGVSRTTLHSIAAEAGVTRGAVYWHFCDKADLFSALLDRLCLPLEDLPADGTGVDAQPLDHVRRMLLRLFDRVAQDAGAQRTLEILTQKLEYVDELLSVRDRYREAGALHIAQIENALLLAQGRGEIAPCVSTRHAALGLHALAEGLVQNWLLDKAAFDLRQAGRDAIDLYLSGLNAPTRAEAALERQPT